MEAGTQGPRQPSGKVADETRSKERPREVIDPSSESFDLRLAIHTVIALDEIKSILGRLKLRAQRKEFDEDALVSFFDKEISRHEVRARRFSTELDFLDETDTDIFMSKAIVTELPRLA
jgi:hypothetical protein